MPLRDAVGTLPAVNKRPIARRSDVLPSIILPKPSADRLAKAAGTMVLSSFPTSPVVIGSPCPSSKDEVFEDTAASTLRPPIVSRNTVAA